MPTVPHRSPRIHPEMYGRYSFGDHGRKAGYKRAAGMCECIACAALEKHVVAYKCGQDSFRDRGRKAGYKRAAGMCECIACAALEERMVCGRDSFGNRGRKAGYTSVLQVCANVSLVPHRGTRGGIGQSIDAAYGVITMTETQHSIKMRSRGARVVPAYVHLCPPLELTTGGRSS